MSAFFTGNPFEFAQTATECLQRTWPGPSYSQNFPGAGDDVNRSTANAFQIPMTANYGALNILPTSPGLPHHQQPQPPFGFPLQQSNMYAAFQLPQPGDVALDSHFSPMVSPFFVPTPSTMSSALQAPCDPSPHLPYSNFSHTVQNYDGNMHSTSTSGLYSSSSSSAMASTSRGTKSSQRTAGPVRNKTTKAERQRISGVQRQSRPVDVASTSAGSSANDVAGAETASAVSVSARPWMDDAALGNTKAERAIGYSNSLGYTGWPRPCPHAVCTKNVAWRERNNGTRPPVYATATQLWRHMLRCAPPGECLFCASTMKIHGRGANVARHRQGGQRCPICTVIVDCGGEDNTTGVYAWLELHDIEHRIEDPQLGKTKTSLGGRLRELHRLLEQGNQAQRRAVENAKPRVQAAELARLQNEQQEQMASRQAGERRRETSGAANGHMSTGRLVYDCRPTVDILSHDQV